MSSLKKKKKIFVFFFQAKRMKNTRIVTLEGFPGTLDAILAACQTIDGVVIIPRSTDSRGNNISRGVAVCSKNILAAAKHVKKCIGFAETIIVPHFFDVPVSRDHNDFRFARAFMARQIRMIRQALHLDEIQMEHIHVRIPHEYTFEILLSNMSCRTLGSCDFSLYKKHLEYSPITLKIDVQCGAFETESMKQEIIEKIFQT